jgi:hypothetical protein
MTEELYILDRPDELDTKGWDIDFGQLLTPKRGVDPYIFAFDNLYENENLSCLFYTINEYRMGAYAGLIGIFKDKHKPTLIANPTNQWFVWQGDRSLTFSDNYLFIRKLAYNQTDKLSGTPFTIFDLDKNVFGFIDFDMTSIYYSPIKINDSVYKFNLDSPEELNAKIQSRHGQTFDLKTIKFYSFDKLDNLIEIYFDEKKNNAC